MLDLQWYDYFRFLSAGLLLYVLYKQGRLLHRNGYMGARLGEVFWVYTSCMFLIFYGSLEAIVENADGGPRSVLAFMVSIIAFRVAQRGTIEKIHEKVSK